MHYGYEDGRRDEIDALRGVIDQLPPTLSQVWRTEWQRVLLAGIGASHAALASPLYALRAGGITASRTDCADFPSVEGQDYDVVLALSQSGRSWETADVVQRFAATGTPTLAITNTDENPLLEASSLRLTLGGLRDSRVSTVGFVVTYASLGMLVDVATTGAVDSRWTDVPSAIELALAHGREAMGRFATDRLASGPVDVVAHASQLTVAEAVALLFREGPLVSATSFGTRGYLHGPMDVASEHTSHVLVGGARELQLAAQLREKYAGVLVVTETLVDSVIAMVPGVHAVQIPSGFTETQRAVIEVCVLQELVAITAELRGNPVDDVAFVRQDTKVNTLAEV